LGDLAVSAADEEAQDAIAANADVGGEADAEGETMDEGHAEAAEQEEQIQYE
jgi:hypothetical protein